MKNAGLLEKLDDKAKKLQEAFFEVITSEASYLRSLNILITHFMAAPELLGTSFTSFFLIFCCFIIPAVIKKRKWSLRASIAT